MNILVSGGGIAGLATALELGNRGHQVTLVERAAHLRVTGAPIDVRGDAIEFADRMGVLPRLREQRIRMAEHGVFVHADGSVAARLPVEEMSDSGDDIEIAREDLARTLADPLPTSTDTVFGDSLDALADDGDGVDVHFVSGRAERFDLVLGADGLHSVTRRLVFGPEGDYLRHLGLYVALTDLPAEARTDDRTSPLYNYPGHLASIARYRNKAFGVFLFRSGLLDYDHRDLDAQKKILLDAFAGHPEWKIPQLLDAVRADPEFYFDSVSQIHLPTWHRGRIALVGDAAHCAALLSGRGTSLAISGAHFLAEELDDAGGDHTVAFERYEQRQRPYAEFAQNSVTDGGELIVPSTREAIDARNKRLQAVAT
ncbi:FAD-dependent monooxygenase [Streptomyces sp. NBC_01288]|uniref:FAD-dependent oxidoreductase n=1 Tax=Streptomyces sp. NBC_01288 TaxID=2903814 RepID=UPI002E0D21DB|nr:FAD-dependent monooxygenase [Streptomyces sp. NBC_01288]